MNANKKMNFLVIEDNLQMSEMISDHLKVKFPESTITVFNSGEEAISGNYPKPDIIVLDFQLDSLNPKALNGLQILMKLKKQYTAPVIFLTAQEKPEVSANLIKYGAYDYVVKNQQAFSKLESVINSILEQEPVKKTGISKNAMMIIVALLIAIIAFAYLFSNR